MADALEPGLVLMDINLPGINGFEATRRITSAHPAAVVMLLSTYQAGDLPGDPDSCGAAAYVHKEEFGPAVIRDVWAPETTTRPDLTTGRSLRIGIPDSPTLAPDYGSLLTASRSPPSGMRPLMRVPSPGADSTAMLPPIAPTRSLMFTKPWPALSARGHVEPRAVVGNHEQQRPLPPRAP